MAHVLYGQKNTRQINLNNIIQHSVSVKKGVKKSTIDFLRSISFTGIESGSSCFTSAADFLTSSDAFVCSFLLSACTLPSGKLFYQQSRGFKSFKFFKGSRN